MDCVPLENPRRYLGKLRFALKTRIYKSMPIFAQEFNTQCLVRNQSPMFVINHTVIRLSMSTNATV